MCVKWFVFLAVLSAGFAASGVFAMRVYTSGEVEAVNGTDVRLRCTFDSSVPTNPSALVVSWSFRPLKPGREQSVFYYHSRPYPPTDGLFRKHAVWDGDITSRDVSIMLREVKFTYNGTFTCQVKNPPDVHGNTGEIRLRVVTTASFSELHILALAIGASIALLVFILVIVFSCRRCKRRRQEQDVNEEVPCKGRKDKTVW